MAIPYIIREARPGDGEQIRLHQLAVASEPGTMLGVDATEVRTADMYHAMAIDHAQSDNSLFLLAESEEQIVAYLRCSGGKLKLSRHVANLSIAVEESFRRRGLGTKLLQRAYTWAKDTDIIKRIELNVFRTNVGAIKLYKKFGFEVEGIKVKSCLHNGTYIDDVIMALLI